MLCFFLRKSGFSFGIRCQVNFLHCWLATKIALCITDLATITGRTDYRRTAQDYTGHRRTTAGQHRTAQDYKAYIRPETARAQTTHGAIDRPKLNNAQHKRINVFINNANRYSGWYVQGHDLYSRMRLLQVTEAIIAN